jgi:hypothetical protein
MAMFGRLLGAAIAGAVLLAGTSALQAQTTPMPSPGVAPTLDSCRDDAIRQGISGDGLAGFLTRCMNQPASASGHRASFERCRSDAVGRGLVGDARADYVDSCMSQSGAMSDTSAVGTYGYCRSEARSRGLMGTQLDDALNQCISR